MIAAKDIGLKAAELLDRLDFKGHSIFDFVGPRNVTMIDVANVLGKVIGKPNLKYTQLPYQDVEKATVASGMKPINAKLMNEMYKAFNEGKIQSTQKITAEHQGKTTIEQFARTFAEAYSPEKAMSK